jgi:hypothetical protein
MEKEDLANAGFSERFTEIILNSVNYESYQFFYNDIDYIFSVIENKNELFVHGKNIDTQNAIMH